MWDTLAIAVTGLSKSYDGRRVLDDISFTVDRGETVAVLGPNGAGKTTTVEILEGFRPRDSGSVEVLGEDPAHPSAAFRTRVGVVLQETRHDPYLTVRETVDLVRGWYPDPLSTDEVLDLVSLSEAGRQRTATLSGGQQRRLDVALGLIGRPELLFLDEPTTGFDPAARREAWDVLRRLKHQGTTVVLTTHYLDEAAALADRLLILAGGRIVAEGPPTTIGGRDLVHRVSFRPDPLLTGDEPDNGVVVDGRWHATVQNITETAHSLSRWADSRNTQLTDLEIVTPSLEEIYLGLIA